jgi:tetratricopeptide (TPR) repeat protein
MQFRGLARVTVLTLTSVSILLPGSAIAQTARIDSVAGPGKVRIQRERRTEWTPARQGSELDQGDQILPDPGVTVTVRCPALPNPVLVRAGVVSGMRSICVSWTTRDIRGDQAQETLGGVDAAIPYLITPRHSLLLSATPLLRWNAVAGATDYTVEVTGPAGVMWTMHTQASQIVYAGKALEAGVPYSVSIHTNTGQSSQADRAPGSEQQAANLEFRLLRKAEADQVKAEVAKIAPGALSNEAEVLTLASLYGNYVLPESVVQAYQLPSDTFATYSLTSEAIALLESWLQQGKPSPLIHRTLGNLYWQTGLVNLAQAQYLKAIDLVQGPEDLEDWTLAQYSLGQVAAALDDAKQALEHYSQARVGYVFLGDVRQAEVLQRRIDRLKETPH